MLVRLKHLITLSSNEHITAYLFCKKTKTLLPVELKVYHKQQNDDFICPTALNTLTRTIKGLQGEAKGILIYKVCGQLCYTYLMLNHQNHLIEINISISDGLSLAELLNIPIYINEKILIQEGICITKEKIENALLSS